MKKSVKTSSSKSSFNVKKPVKRPADPYEPEYPWHIEINPSGFSHIGPNGEFRTKKEAREANRLHKSDDAFHHAVNPIPKPKHNSVSGSGKSTPRRSVSVKNNGHSTDRSFL